MKKFKGTLPLLGLGAATMLLLVAFATVVLPPLQVGKLQFMNSHSKYFGIVANESTNTNVTFTLPIGDSTSHFELGTNGAGRFIWIDPGTIHVGIADSLKGIDTSRIVMIDKTNTMTTIGFIRGSDGFITMRTPNEAKTVTLHSQNSGSNYSFDFPNPAGHEGDYMKVVSGVNTYAPAPDSVRTSGRVFRFRVGSGSYYQDSVTVIASTNMVITLSHDTLVFSSADSVSKSYSSQVSRHTMWFTAKKSQPTKADSSFCLEVPFSQTWTIDSVKASKKGAFTCTVNVDRLRSGTYARVYSSNYSLTTTHTNMGSATNNTLIAADQVYIVWPSFSGTTDVSDEINYTFFYRLTQ